MADGSTKVVYAALAGNVAVAAAKFGAYAVSGSSALLTESIHSLVDSADQVLLLVGQARGKRPPDAAHPLGHGMETYFWTFIVAVMVLLAGGAASLYEGVRHIMKPEPIASPAISFGVLALAAVFEGSSLAVGFREYKRVVRGRNLPLWDFILLSKDPSLYASLLEDSAALIGLAIAALGVLAATVFRHGVGGRGGIDCDRRSAGDCRLHPRERNAQPDRRRGGLASRDGQDQATAGARRAHRDRCRDRDHSSGAASRSRRAHPPVQVGHDHEQLAGSDSRVDGVDGAIGPADSVRLRPSCAGLNHRFRPPQRLHKEFIGTQPSAAALARRLILPGYSSDE